MVQVLDDLVEGRTRVAQELGFPSFADMVTKQRMFSSVDVGPLPYLPCCARLSGLTSDTAGLCWCMWSPQEVLAFLRQVSAAARQKVGLTPGTLPRLSYLTLRLLPG